MSERIEKVYTLTEAAAKLRCSPRTVRHYCDAGLLSWLPGGVGAKRKHRTIPRSAIVAFQQAQVREANREDVRAAYRAVRAGVEAVRPGPSRYSAEALRARGLLSA
jgi:hypothetical protein